MWPIEVSRYAPSQLKLGEDWLRIIIRIDSSRPFTFWIAYVLSLLHRQLLIEHGGPDNENVKSFFTLYTDVQASATCLVLACSRAIQDQHIAEWATRAFLLYGGEPKLMYPPQQQQQLNRAPGLPPGIQGSINMTPNMLSTHPLHSPGSPTLSNIHPHATFHPNIASTPAQPLPPPHLQSVRSPLSPFPTGRPEPHPFAAAAAAHGQSIFGVAPPPQIVPEIQYSGKHNGLYLYFSRLIRPFWLKTLVVPTADKVRKANYCHEIVYTRISI